MMHNYFHFNGITCFGEKASLENYQVALNQVSCERSQTGINESYLLLTTIHLNHSHGTVSTLFLITLLCSKFYTFYI